MTTKITLGGTERTRVRRAPARAVKEESALRAIIDEALICHVGFVDRGHPFVIPTLGWQDGDYLYLHGSNGSRMLNVLLRGGEACVTFTLLDGLVMARSAFHHSANYRSAVVLGTAEPVMATADKLAALEVFMDRIAPGRWPALRETNSQEIDATTVLRIRLDEASVKMRTGDPIDDDGDLGFPVWAGVIPVRQVFGPPARAADCGDEPTPDFAPAFGDRWRGNQNPR